MASMACRTFSWLECTSSLEQGACKRAAWPVWQVARVSPSSKLSKKPLRRTAVGCSARETQVSEQTTLDSQPAESQSDFLTSRVLDNAHDGSQAGVQSHQLPTLERDRVVEDLQLPLESAQETAQAGMTVATQVDLQVKEHEVEVEEEEEEFLKGFPGAKGAVVKPLSADVAAQFPEGYLSSLTDVDRLNWVTIVPTGMLPKGEDRLVFKHYQDTVMLFWLKGRIYAIENRSPSAAMHEEGFAKAVITEDGIITCPVTQSKYDIRTGICVDWLPNNPIQRLLTPVLNDFTVYDVKATPDHIFINTYPLLVGGMYPLAEFTGNRIWTGPNYEKPIIFDDLEFGFTEENELSNGRLAMLGFLSLLLIEMTTGEGILKGSGILDYLYTNFLPNFPLLRY